jgi:hypothetical protein
MLMLEFKMRKYLVHITLLIGFVGFSQSQPKVYVKTDTTKIRIGETINYEIVVDNADTGVNFSEIQLDSFARVEVVESFDIDTLKNRLIKKYALTSFDSGRYVIPRQRVFIWSQEYMTDSLIIDVNTIAVDTTKQQMFTIKAIQNEPYTFDDLKSYLWWILLALFLIALILYLIFRKKETPEEREARIPPYQLALKRLNELDEKQLWQKNKIKEYYVELTGILRNYIEREMKIPALESTSDELLETITDFNSSSSLNIPKETIGKLQKLLKESDLVKFAKYKPLANEIELHRNDTNTIIDSINENIPKIVVEKPKCIITKEDATDTITLYKWFVPIINFKMKRQKVLVSEKGRALQQKEQSYFWSIFNPVGNLIIQIPFLGGYLMLIWSLICIPIALPFVVVELILGKKPLKRGLVLLKKNGDIVIKNNGVDEVVG